jgi:hypothetical protein
VSDCGSTGGYLCITVSNLSRTPLYAPVFNSFRCVQINLGIPIIYFCENVLLKKQPVFKVLTTEAQQTIY